MNDAERDIVERLAQKVTQQKAEAYELGLKEGLAQGTAVRLILTDLIAELVSDNGDGHAITPDATDGACYVCEALERAVARLREATGGE